MALNKKKASSALKDEAMPATSDIRTSLSNAALKKAVLDHLLYSSGESLFLRKLVLGIPAQASGKNLTRPLMPAAPQPSCYTRFMPNKGHKTSCAMTRRDFVMLCNFTPQTALREIAQPYRFWGLLGFPPRSVGRVPAVAPERAYYQALALTVRDRLQHHWSNTVQAYFAHVSSKKIACYFSAEFLIGPQLGSSLVNLGIEHEVRAAVAELGKNLDDLIALEEEPGLGNGGLGRLAACYLDSLATLERPAIGYGIRYEFGIFDQEIHDGWQVEITDKWLRNGNPWEIAKPDIAYYVNFGGHSESYQDNQGCIRMRWIPHRVVKGVAFDTPVPGYRVNTCNTLRLWSAEACESFNFQAFNTGDYYQAVDDKVISETLTKVLYPNDEPEAGKKLRLAQQYFFVSCSLQDMLRLLDLAGDTLERFPDRYAAQLNDTHPSIAVAELMRILVDERLLDWDPAWNITFRTFGYTNHTLLPEALETWSLPLFSELLPRHLEIIYEINTRFLDEVRLRYPGDNQRVMRLSLIDETGEKRVRMAHLACVGSHAINGVAALHSELLKTSVLKDFYELWPERFSNKTNGVTPRRFMALANPKLSDLITGKIGGGWITQTEELKQLELFAKAGSRYFCESLFWASQPKQAAKT